MPKYVDTSGNVSEIGSPELNPDLVAGKTLVPDSTKLGSGYGSAPITSSLLAPSPTIQPVYPNPVGVYPVSGLNTPTPPMAPTAPETEASDLIKRLRVLNDQNTGQSAYRASQEAAQNIPELTKTQNDLTARLTALKNEALAIPLQLQQDVTGRGVTAGGLAPIEMAALRKNAIAALGVSSLLEASRGNLTTAMAMVDRAVAQHFDPLKEEIAAKTANLDLILKSPEYTLADKNRAQAQKDIEDAKARAVALQEENVKTALAMAAAAVKLNPNDQGALLAAQQLQQLDPSSPNYLSTAFSLLGKYQSDPQALLKGLDEHLKTQQDILESQLKVAREPLERQKLQGEIDTSKATQAKLYAEANQIKSGGDQNKLEQQYRQILLKPLSNRSGGLGLEDAKVNQAIHLKAVFDQYRDPKTGDYNIPKVLYNELALGLARLISPTGVVGAEVQKSVTQETAKGGLAAMYTYITGEPITGTTQDVLKVMKDSIDRQGGVAEQNRDQYMTYLRALVPTQLDQNRVDALESGLLNSYNNPTKSSQGNQSELGAGEILIERNGVRGKIPAGEFDPKTDKKL